MTRMGKRLAAVFLAVAIVVTFMPVLGTQTVYAADDRTEIHSVTITSTGFSDNFVNGGYLSWIVFSSDENDPVQVHDKKWEQKVDGAWVNRSGGVFSTGTWRVSLQVKIDGENGLRYKLGAPFTAIVDGTEWTESNEPYVDETSSFNWIKSPEMEIEAPSELTIHDDSAYDIGISYVGRAIDVKSVASCADGGVKPYSFSKQSGPDWLTVDSGGNITGTPLSTGSNEDMVIRVTDQTDAYADLTISVGDTVIDPADRTVITSAALTTEENLTPLHNDKMPGVILFSAEEGNPVIVCNLACMKKEGDEWKQVTAAKFSPGTWRWKAQIRIEAEDSLLYVLDDPFTATVNGEDWITESSVQVGDTFSYVWVESPEFLILGDIKYADIEGVADKTYTGKAVTQSPVVKIDGTTLESGTDYTVDYENNTNAGTAAMTITGKGDYIGTITKTFNINKAANPLTMKAKTATVKYSKLKKKAQTLAVTKVIKFTKDAKDKKTYTLSSAKKGKKSFKKYFKINKTTGKVTVKKGLKKGTYKVKVKVKALGNANYKASAVKTVTFKVKVK